MSLDEKLGLSEGSAWLTVPRLMLTNVVLLLGNRPPVGHNGVLNVYNDRWHCMCNDATYSLYVCDATFPTPFSGTTVQ